LLGSCPGGSYTWADDVGNQEISELRERVAALDRELEIRATVEEELRAAERARTGQALSVLRHTEQRFRALFDSNVIGIVEINHERVLDANESFLQMTGRSREAVLSGKLLWGEMTPSKYRRIDQAAHDLVIRNGSFPPFEKEFYREDGTTVPVWVGGVLLNPPPDWTCMAFVLDLSERKALEEQFNSAQKLKSLGLLSSVIAHDFNNLLTTMIGNASLSLDALTPGHPAYGPIEEILRASNLASGLTNQLVGYSSKPRSKAKILDISNLVREIGDLIELPLSRKVQLVWNLAPGLPMVNGDAYLIQQILMNLVINASDALGETDGIIRIVTHCRDYSAEDLQGMTMSSGVPAGSYVAVEVHDNGCGMTDEVKSRIFDAMFTTKAKGRGLGLAATLGIVRSHHGAIDVRSQLQKGTTFTVLFPAASDGMETVTAAAEGDQNLSGNGTILVVDDEPSVRRLAEATLTRYGYRVILASDGKEGVEIYRKAAGSITLIIMDVSMPVLNGEEALQELLQIEPNLQVLFSSGFNATDSMKHLANYPFLPKPYTSRELAERVKELHSVPSR